MKRCEEEAGDQSVYLIKDPVQAGAIIEAGHLCQGYVRLNSAVHVIEGAVFTKARRR